MNISGENIKEGGDPSLSPELQELADMAGKFDTEGSDGQDNKERYSDDSDEVKEESTEQLTRTLEQLDGYEIYGPELEERLKRDEEAARINSLAMESDPSRSGSLILVCAQHPLTQDGKPGKAFSARLDEAIMRYEMMKKKGESVIIRVPGAVHFGDSRSLAEAGKEYLMEHGIPEEDISADGTEGNGTDEVTFAYNIFEQACCRQFHICCGENQVFRNKMACMELLGFLPYFHTTTVLEEMPHRIGYEIGNPKGGLRFLRVDQGVSVDNSIKKQHIEGSEGV